VPAWIQIILVVIGLLLGCSLIASWWRDRYR
jgi:hypothetical protein